MSSFNVTFVARTPPPGLNSKEGRPTFASLGRIDATSNRSDSSGIGCALRIPVRGLEVTTRNPSKNTLAVQLVQTLGIGVLITNSCSNRNRVAFPPEPSYHPHQDKGSEIRRPEEVDHGLNGKPPGPGPLSPNAIMMNKTHRVVNRKKDETECGSRKCWPATPAHYCVSFRLVNGRPVYLV